MATLRILILGDDFTPAALFEEAIRRSVGASVETAEFCCVDTEPNELSSVRSEEVSEAFGDIAEVARLARACHVIVTTFAPVTEQVLDRAPDLLAIACGRGGPVNINVAAATRRSIPVLYAPGRNAQAVAEYTLAAMFNLMRRIPQAMDYLRGGQWQTPREDTFEKPSGPELGGRTLGLIGCGQVGRLVAKLAQAVGTRVLVCDPFAEGPALEALGMEPVTLEEILAEADVISIHARLASGEPPILGQSQFTAMARRPYVLNTARAAALDYGALTAALESGQVSGAFLDVYPDEPIASDSPLLAIDRDRLHMTPHAAGVSRDIPLYTARTLADGLAQLLQGKRPAHVVNEDALASGLERITALQKEQGNSTE